MTSLTREQAFRRLARWCDQDQPLTITLIMNSQPRRLPARVRNFSLEQHKVLLEVVADGLPQLWRVCLASAAFSSSDPAPDAATELHIELLPGRTRYIVTEAKGVTSLRRDWRAQAAAAGASRMVE